jgi:FkbM family methyltransferase
MVSIPDVSGRQPARRAGLHHRAAHAVRRGASRAWDPTVSFELYGHRLELPMSHPLPHYMRFGPQYGTNVGRLAAHLATDAGECRVIDIGANIGDTAIVVLARAPGASILCIEGDRDYFTLLCRNVAHLPRVTATHRLVVGLPEQAGVAIDTKRGTGHVVRGAETAAATPTATLPALLAEFPDFADAELFKTDTDGFDFTILAGSLDWLADRRPAVFLEYDPIQSARSAPDGPTGPELLDELAGIGYGPMVVWDNFGYLLGRYDANDRAAVADLDTYSRLRENFYLDIAIFDGGDAAVAEQVRAAEHRYFS